MEKRGSKFRVGLVTVEGVGQTAKAPVPDAVGLVAMAAEYVGGGLFGVGAAWAGRRFSFLPSDQCGGDPTLFRVELGYPPTGTEGGVVHGSGETRPIKVWGVAAGYRACL